MISRYSYAVALIILFLSLSACSSTNSELMKNDAAPSQVNSIVVMPVDNKTKDVRIQQLLRTRLLEELRFKGYSQTAAAVDGKTVSRDNFGEEGKTSQSFMKNAPAIQGADAALYCTLQESRASTVFFYSPATVSVRCELRSTKTGETIWNAQHRSTSRSFDVMNSALKSSGALESALEDAVGKVMETLPYGPMLRG